MLLIGYLGRILKQLLWEYGINSKGDTKGYFLYFFFLHKVKDISDLENIVIVLLLLLVFDVMFTSSFLSNLL